MKKAIVAFVALALVMAVIAPAFSQETVPEKSGMKAPLKKEVVLLKYLKADKVQNFIYTFLTPGVGRVTSGPTEGSLVISDYPENVEQALQAIRKIDVKPADLQFTVQLVLGSETSGEGDDVIQRDPVVNELRNLLRYKSYNLLDSTVIRAMDGSDSEVRLGKKGDFEFYVRPKVIKDEKSSLIQMEVRLRQIFLLSYPATAVPAPNQPYERSTTLISSTLNLKPGDKTVVGVSKLDGGDKGLILIISGKIVD